MKADWQGLVYKLDDGNTRWLNYSPSIILKSYKNYSQKLHNFFNFFLEQLYCPYMRTLATDYTGYDIQYKCIYKHGKYLGCMQFI